MVPMKSLLTLVATLLLTTSGAHAQAGGFETIGSTTKNHNLRSAAIALANLARRLRDSGAHIMTGAARWNVLASPDQESGRARLVINTTLAAFCSSFALVDVLGVGDLTPITLTIAASTAAGLGISLYATRIGRPLLAATRAGRKAGRRSLLRS